MLCERPTHIGEFLKNWVSKPQHQSLLTPSVVKASQWKIGESVMAKWGSEPHRAKIYKIDDSDFITVLWEAEWSTSVVPVVDIFPVAPPVASKADTMTSLLEVQSQTDSEAVDPSGNIETPTSEQDKQSENDKQDPSDSDSTMCESPAHENSSEPTWSSRLAAGSSKEVPVVRTPSRKVLVTPSRGLGSSLSASPQSRTTETDWQLRVRTFLAEGNVDKEAHEALLKATLEVQQIVIDRGSLTNTRKPSALVQKRIREAYEMLHQCASEKGGSLASRVKAFLNENKVDDRASIALRSSKESVQEKVLSRGSLISAKCPTAALMSRIAEAQKSKA